ncbi:uncharacterized protein LOC131009590 [Salvia miltiorrhiza]|uniref:uncharacterized protein LOC131009590 n=1 Tax=Salvia miltiorrhiza TaxID=226208 RepID=UPI0025AD06A6|nr:uncharacterized protein LOC131009590 [Salvia miltiorrhiza]
MAKGFFIVKFLTMEAKKKAKGSSFLQLSIGHVRFREWTRYFDPYKEVSSLAQVWVRIYYLPVELWTPVIIAGIGRVLGHPLRIDNASATGHVRHFARVLMELDMALPILNSIYIDDGDRSFYIEFGFESMPLFCSRCKFTGHSTDKCRRADRATSRQKIIEEPPALVVKNLAKGEGPTPAWQPKVDIAKPLSGPDLLETATVPKVEETIIADSNYEADVALNEGENDGSPHTDNNLASDKEGSNVEGTLELEDQDSSSVRSIGDKVLPKMRATTNFPGQVLRAKYLPPGTNSGVVVYQQSVVGAEGSTSQRVNSPIKEVDFDKQSNPTPDEMASRIIRLEEQIERWHKLGKHVGIQSDGVAATLQREEHRREDNSAQFCREAGGPAEGDLVLSE